MQIAKGQKDVVNERIALQELISLRSNVSKYTQDQCTNLLKQIKDEIKNRNFLSAAQYFENARYYCSSENDLNSIEIDLYLSHAKYLVEEIESNDRILNQALEVINLFIEKFPNQINDIASLKKKTYEKLINISLKNNLYLKAIEYSNQMNIQFSSDSITFNLINNIGNYILESNETGPKEWNQIIFLVDKLLTPSKNSLIRANAKNIARKANIKIALYLKGENCYTEAIEILNQLLIDSPSDDEIKQIRSEIYFLLGNKLYKKREYDLAYICYKQTERVGGYIGIQGSAAIASMYDRIQIYDSTLFYLLKIIGSSYLSDKKRNELKYKCAQIYALQNRPYNSMEMLRGIQNTNEYDYYREKAKRDNLLYNLDPYKPFHLWADAKTGLRISNFRGKINYNPDKGKFFDMIDYKGPDLYLEVFKGEYKILTTETQWGNYSPAWSKYSEYVINKKWNEAIELSIEIWDDDGGAPFRPNTLQGTAYFKINSFGEINPYSILTSSNTPVNGKLDLKLLSTETLDPPYNYTARRQVLCIGLWQLL